MAYNIRLRPGVVFGVGVSLDTQNLNEAAHKVWKFILKAGRPLNNRSRLARRSILRDRLPLDQVLSSRRASQVSPGVVDVTLISSLLRTNSVSKPL